MKSSYSGVAVPKDGQAIEYSGGEFHVPDRPIIPFIEGDGTGRDIWKASRRVFDAAVEKVFGGKRKIAWLEIYAGEKSFNQFKDWLPPDSVDAIRDFRVAIKGPLTTPVGGGIRSLNVTLRQLLDLYACVRPVRYFEGVPSPVLHPERMNIVIFRENTEDVYAGIEWKSGTPEVKKLADFINNEMLKGTGKRLPDNAGIGIKPISPQNTKRLVRRAIQHALEKKRRTVTLVHKGNIMKFTEGAFRDWGYELAVEEFRQQIVTERESWILDNKDRDAQHLDREKRRVDRAGPRSGHRRLQEKDLRRGEADARFDLCVARPRPVEAEGAGQRPHRGFDLPAGADARGRIPGARDAEPEWRLYLGRVRGAGRRPRHGAGREYRRRLRLLRGNAWHGAEICR